MSLPRLDFSLFLNGDDSERQKLASELFASLAQHGFVRLVNHGITDSEVNRLFQWSRSFFGTPIEERIAIQNVAGPNPQRGWSSLGAENTAKLYEKGFLSKKVAADLKDAREHFDWAATSDLTYPNRWPSEEVLPGFRDAMQESFLRLEQVSLAIMEALEVAMGLPSGAFLGKISHASNASEMRLLHYPELDVQEIRKGKVNRIWPHFDLGVITLLFQDGTGGLEFENREVPGTFSRVECGEHSDMIVNVSETLQRWTNNTLRAGLHRVNVPEHLEGKDTGILPERYSITYFCKANRNASVGVLKELMPQDMMPMYEDMTAIEYHTRRLQSAY
ncbi:putative gibberellin 20-oxidase [Xylaria bambusicola]|uniref:putative gibberellin 20-oxidase n=1 Tax=Xylaria bambusicola TaxID=326684 RepID=UPI00200835EE|nr:putative gibberellin 20-oxidase [Xylaria bambusicola]KAI0517552.1 putative gibberellin 20-oxidase [Xylaria bambusicola]